MDIGYELMRLHRQIRRLEKQIKACQAQVEYCLSIPDRDSLRHEEGIRIQEGSAMPDKAAVV